jgi:hypothetical protein
MAEAPLPLPTFESSRQLGTAATGMKQARLKAGLPPMPGV